MPQTGQRSVLWLLLAALLLFLLRIAWPFVSAFFLASMLATVIHPVNRRLIGRLGRPGLASFLTTLATVTVLGATVVFVGVAVVKDAERTYETLHQRSLEEGGWPALITHTTDRIVDALATRLPVAKEKIREQVVASMKAGASYVVGKTRAAIEGLASIVVTSVFAAIFLYYLLRYGEGWLGRVGALIPLRPETTAHLLRTAHHSIVANVNGVIAVGLAQGLFLSLGFWLVGIGSPLLWGMFGAIASVIPFVGATLIWVPAVIGFVLMGAYGKALALGLWGGLVVGSLDNILRPLIVGAREKQNPVLVGFAMLGGTYAMGPLGLFLGPLVVALAGATAEEVHGMRPISDAVPLSAMDDPAEQTSKPEVRFTTVLFE